jgi:hypothetical protein
MNQREHPDATDLQRFMRGEGAFGERQAVVRHLLTGCTQCLQVTRPIWRLAEEPPLKIPKGKVAPAGILRAQRDAAAKPVAYRRKERVA